MNMKWQYTKTYGKKGKFIANSYINKRDVLRSGQDGSIDTSGTRILPQPYQTYN